MFAGDSVTDCGRRTDPDGLGDGYVRTLYDGLDPRRPRIVNAGISGNRAADLAGRWSFDVLAHEPSLVSILIGINDTWRRYDENDPTTAESFEDSCRAMLDPLTCPVVLIEPFLLPVKDRQEEWREDLDPKLDVTRELAADPLFELGTHTYDHRGFTKHCYTLGTVPRADMLADVRRAVVELDQLDSHATRWFRFPGGCYDGTALHELASAGVTAVGLDVPGADGFAKSPTPVVKQVLSNVRNGSIVVLHMHGGDNAPYTDEALGPIVKGLRARGYQLVTVTQLMISRR